MDPTCVTSRAPWSGETRLPCDGIHLTVLADPGPNPLRTMEGVVASLLERVCPNSGPRRAIVVYLTPETEDLCLDNSDPNRTLHDFWNPLPLVAVGGTLCDRSP
jgi:hypothetical protein